jgi:hypothetical protein
VRLTFLGDSYDIVKQSFLRWLGVLGPWSAHPMFTEVFSNEQGETFRRLLGVPLVSTEVFRTGIDRKVFLAPARTCTTHLFLDPDKGVHYNDK